MSMNLLGGFAFMGPQMMQPGGNNSYMAGLQAGFQSAMMGGGDGFRGSAGLMECNRGGVLGGLNNFGGSPMMGLGGFNQTNPQQMRAMSLIMGMMAGLMASQGMRGQNLGGPCNGNPMQGMQGMGGPGCMRGPQQMGGPQGQQGGVIELTKGQSFTTPGGATINWQGDEVKVHEPGGGSQAHGAGAAGRSFGGGNQKMMGAVMAGPGFAMGIAVAAGGTGGASGCGCHHASGDQKPKDWRVWGDPHIDHPDGSKSDFKEKNAMFTLQDGTRVMMGADNPKGVTQKVQIILPGAQPQWGNGYDPKHTSVMQDNGSGHFNDMGTADKFMGGGYGGGCGFQQGGFNPMQMMMGMFA